MTVSGCRQVRSPQRAGPHAFPYGQCRHSPACWLTGPVEEVVQCLSSQYSARTCCISSMALGAQDKGDEGQNPWPAAHSVGRALGRRHAHTPLSGALTSSQDSLSGGVKHFGSRPKQSFNLPRDLHQVTSFLGDCGSSWTRWALASCARKVVARVTWELLFTGRVLGTQRLLGRKGVQKAPVAPLNPFFSCRRTVMMMMI